MTTTILRWLGILPWLGTPCNRTLASMIAEGRAKRVEIDNELRQRAFRTVGPYFIARLRGSLYWFVLEEGRHGRLTPRHSSTTASLAIMWATKRLKENGRKF